MRLQVKGRNVEVSESIRRYAEEKLAKIVDKLERQVKRYRAKRSRRETARRADGHASAEPQFTAEQLERMIVKSKQFDLQSMSPDEATLQLELIGHDFFVFRNESSGRTEVVYRRRDGGYGHIQPQE